MSSPSTDGGASTGPGPGPCGAGGSAAPGAPPAAGLLAITADLVGSRELADREVVQRRLIEAVEAQNRLLGSALVGPLRFNAGDELQALLRDPERGVDCLVALTEAAQPARLAAGFGFGGLTVGEVSAAPARVADIAVLDGPCFHAAREALGEAQQDGAWARVRGFGEPLDGAASALLELLGRLRDGWTERQAEIVAAARGRLQKDVAQELGVSPSVISEALKAADFEAVQRAERALSALLSATLRQR